MQASTQRYVMCLSSMILSKKTEFNCVRLRFLCKLNGLLKERLVKMVSFIGVFADLVLAWPPVRLSCTRMLWRTRSQTAAVAASTRRHLHHLQQLQAHQRLCTVPTSVHPRCMSPRTTVTLGSHRQTRIQSQRCRSRIY